MSSVYSKRLAGPVAASTTAGVIYTVPPGVVAVVRQLHIVGFSRTADTNVSLFIGGSSTGSYVYRRRWTADGTEIIETYLPMVEGEQLLARRETGLGVTITVAGFEFDASA